MRARSLVDCPAVALRVRIPILLLAALGVLAAGPGVASGDAGDHVDVVEVSGPLDQRLIDYLANAVSGAGGQLVVLALNAPGISSGDVAVLATVIEDSSVPVAVWIGPEPAAAYGGVATEILPAAPIRAAAPGSRLGYLVPAVAGGTGDELDPDFPPELAGADVEITGPLPGLIDFLFPSVGQLIVGLDGVEVVLATGESVALETAEPATDDGATTMRPAVEVRFAKPDLLSRFLRLGAGPEAAVFFLVAGLLFAAFEFYAAGPGLMAAVAAVALFLAGYGIAVLPVRWWAVGLVVAGVGFLLWEFQRETLGVKTIAGAVVLGTGALFFADTAPQFPARWWVLVLIVAGALLFVGFALPTVVRARFSTRTIGREYLVGRMGTAEESIDPEGVVVVDGARWRARSGRDSGIEAGDPVRVVAVSGIVLEVETVRD
jgi:membrane-bound serine protease (ClpP class)